MSATTSVPVELPEIDVRALTEVMTVLPEAPGLYTVVSGSGRAYTVDAREGACSCPDARYRDRECKHQVRVAYERGDRMLPGWDDRGSVDDHFRQFVTPSDVQEGCDA